MYSFTNPDWSKFWFNNNSWIRSLLLLLCLLLLLLLKLKKIAVDEGYSYTYCYCYFWQKLDIGEDIEVDTAIAEANYIFLLLFVKIHESECLKSIKNTVRAYNFIQRARFSCKKSILNKYSSRWRGSYSSISTSAIKVAIAATISPHSQTNFWIQFKRFIYMYY